MDIRTNTFGLIIQYEDISNNLKITHNDLLDLVKSCDYIKFYAFILHNMDKKPNGEDKTLHYHLVIYTFKQYERCTILNDFARKLQCDKNIISIRPIDIVEGVQYLTHLNEKDKYMYNDYEVFTNDISNYESIMDEGICLYDVTIDYLIKIIKCCKSKSQLYNELGLKNSLKLRNIINDLWKEIKL